MINAKTPAILVLENNPLLSRQYGNLLNEAGYHAYLAPTISDAHVLLTTKESFDVFLCDMPIDQDPTFNLLREARQHHLQIIVVANSALFKTKNNELKSVFFLEKSADVNTFYALIARALASSAVDSSK